MDPSGNPTAGKGGAPAVAVDNSADLGKRSEGGAAGGSGQDGASSAGSGAKGSSRNSAKAGGSSNSERGPAKTSTPAKKGSLTPRASRRANSNNSRRGSLTTTSDFLMKEQQELDKPATTQTKIAEYLRKVKESKKEKEGLEKNRQDFRSNHTATTPANPMAAAPSAGMASRAPSGATAAGLREAAAAASTVAPTVALVANSMADALDKNKSMIPGLNWAAEVDKEKAARKSVCTVKIGQDEDKAAKEALDEERNKKGRQTSRYRTVSSSSSVSAVGGLGIA